MKSVKWDNMYHKVWRLTKDKPLGTPKSSPMRISLTSSTCDDAQPVLEESETHSSPKQIQESQLGSSLIEESPSQDGQGGEVPMELTQITDAPMREENIEYATIEVMPDEEPEQQPV